MSEGNSELIFAGASDKGRVRKNNEDCILMSRFKHSDAVLVAVADGVGGSAGGEVASQLTVKTMYRVVKRAILQSNSGGGYGKKWLNLTLARAIKKANIEVIKQQAINEELENMATTIVALLIHKNKMALSHLGDSRCYQFKNNKLKQKTQDHTLLQLMLNRGEITQENFDVSPMHHMICKAVGSKEDVSLSVEEFEIDPQSTYLLCSDGLTDCLSDEQIEKILIKFESLDEAVEELIISANNHGGVDNISVVLVKCAKS